MVYGQQVTVEITLPELTAVSIEGSGDLSLEELHQDEIDLAITGSGTIRATGQVHLLVAAISGSGDVKAKDLTASIAELRISGSGDIKVWGSPAKRDTRVSGSGGIRFK